MVLKRQNSPNSTTTRFLTFLLPLKSQKNMFMVHVSCVRGSLTHSSKNTNILSIYLPTYLSIYLPSYLPIYLSIYLALCNGKNTLLSISSDHFTLQLMMFAVFFCFSQSLLLRVYNVFLQRFDPRLSFTKKHFDKW